LVFFPFLAEGYTVIVPDIEGQRADFAAGPEYGMNTLDSIRAALSSKEVGLPSDAKVAMLGYSGGGIATEWAAELAPTYAPDAFDVNKHLIGAAMGGLLVHPAHNLHYIEGTPFWGGVMLMALVGIVRAFDQEDEFKPYLNAKGVQLFDAMKTKSIVNVLGQYWDPMKCGLKWEDLAKPEYRAPESIPLYVECVNKLIIGTGGVPGHATKPEIPLFIGQGAKGEREGTPSHEVYGPGDGVMIAGDVRTLARDYCAKDIPVWYEQYNGDSHITSLLIWLPNAIAWIKQRFEGQPAPQNWLPNAIAGIRQGFEGVPAPQNCPSMPEGNPLDPLPVPQESRPAPRRNPSSTPHPRRKS
jgi:pimeloyl-ACP methyl ester carboxylesterase